MALRPYTFFKHDGASVVPVFDLGEFEDDAAARAHAERLLEESPQYRVVEVWNGWGQPFRVERPSKV